MAIKNTSEYSWCDINVAMLGRKISGITNVKYGSTQEKELIYAAGNNPHGVGRANKKPMAEMTILFSELRALIDSAGGDICDIPPFDIVIAYTPKNSTLIRTDVVQQCEFLGVEIDWKQADKFKEITLPLITLGVDWNI